MRRPFLVWAIDGLGLLLRLRRFYFREYAVLPPQVRGFISAGTRLNQLIEKAECVSLGSQKTYQCDSSSCPARDGDCIVVRLHRTPLRAA